jgi:hypothetical protein
MNGVVNRQLVSAAYTLPFVAADGQAALCRAMQGARLQLARVALAKGIQE